MSRISIHEVGVPHEKVMLPYVPPSDVVNVVSLGCHALAAIVTPLRRCHLYDSDVGVAMRSFVFVYNI